MIFSSVKNSIYVIIVGIVLQTALLGVDILLNQKHEQLEQRLVQFSRIEHTLLTIMDREKDVAHTLISKRDLLFKYREMIITNKKDKLGLNPQLMEKRSRILAELFEFRNERERLYKELNDTLPALAASVTYIHKHHITYLKNLIRRGEFEQDYDVQETFSRHDSRPGSELDIVSAAIHIQSTMLEIMELFSKLQSGFSPASISNSFNEAIDRFYNETNTFEDYSLDAQDGLLVEELLLNGVTFERSFKRFLKLETTIHDIGKWQEQNRVALLENFAAVKKNLDNEYTEFSNIIQINKSISLVVNVIILLVLLTITRKMLLALNKVVGETGKIESDHTYRIPLQDHDFKEFTYIFSALNNMGEGISKKIDELALARAVLEERVAERTQELSLANIQLSGEIEERKKNDLERRGLEERLNRAEKMEAVGTLAGGVAHDLNNILSGIASYPELLLIDLPEGHKFRGPLQTIKNAGEKAAVIVDDLLTMTRRGVAIQEQISLNQLVDSILTSHELSNILVHHHGIEVVSHLNAQPDVILGSRVHLLKTILNLTSNAAESIPSSGTITISTSNETIDAEIKGYDQVNKGEYVKFTIADNGAGIPKENIERIFEPFFTTKKMGRSGSGLGMAVVWGTVKDHNGYINLSSEVNKGTTFDLYFPLAADQEMLASEQDNLSALQSRGEKILVVDDIREQREIACHMLSRLGYFVESVNSGEEAVAYLLENEADILLLDMIMHPGMDGLETYRTVLEFLPQQKAIIASGFSENTKVREAQAIGAGAYVKKPYSIYEIARVLRAELD